jgi:DNA polymerase-3 subunit gamma/tau
MSYQVIARKWRPQTFAEVTGQEPITQTLRNAIEYDRLHHAYLFSGARGVGKTTTARILAKCLNCHKSDKPTVTPCLLTDPDPCDSCIEISESRSMDVLEIDAASHTGIDDVRGTIIENITFNPARDRFKVFIIDEVHQLSKPAFNALLKTLEEPPGNVLFVMATTELHKVPETILSRCQEFEFRTIPLQKIFDRLKLIAESEKIDISDDALRELARSGEGSMRDAQSNFDQVISFSGEKITSADVTNALGFAGVEILTKTMDAIAGRDPKAMLAVVDDIIGRGHDLRNFCRDLLGLFRDLLVFKVAADQKQLFEGAVFSESELQAMAASFTEADLMRFFNSLCETEASLREAAHPRYVLEIGLVKLIEMRSVTSIESILERLNAISPDTVPQPADLKAAAPGPAPSASPEKKTLNPEPPPAFADDDYPEPVEESGFNAAEVMVDIPPHLAEPPPAYYPPSPRLPALTTAELEHFDDNRLDEAYEEKLTVTGDDLLPISGAADLVQPLVAPFSVATRAPRGANGTAAAAVPAFDVAALRNEISPKPEPVDIPELSEQPTETELVEYAKAHPNVQDAIRVFRAKIVEIKRS